MKYLSLLFITLFMVTACNSWQGEREGPRLEGTRLDVFKQSNTTQLLPSSFSQEISLPDPIHNLVWPQAGGLPDHRQTHFALSPNTLKKTWEYSLTHNGTNQQPLLSSPIIINDRLYVLDSKSILHAFDTDKRKEIWTYDLNKTLKKNERERIVSGGIGYGEGFLFATAGDNRVMAFDPEKGQIVWTTTLPIATRTPPSISDGRVFITTMDNRLYALDAANGQVLWFHQGIPETIALLGYASPAIDGTTVVPAYSSGELYALRTENGTTAWMDNLSSVKLRNKVGKLNDISGMPVIDNNKLFAGSYSGNFVAISMQSGQRLWRQEITLADTPTLVGDYLFITTNTGRVLCVSALNGSILWDTQLQAYQDEENKFLPIAWTAPILGGEKLYTLNSIGDMAILDPYNGALLKQKNIGKSFFIAPIIANQTLYLLDNNGKLLAYR